MYKILVLFLALLLLGVLCCSATASTLERNGVVNLNIKEQKNNSQSVLRITGLCMHSSYVVTGIKQSENQGVLNIKVEIGYVLFNKGSGSFDYKIELPQTVNRVSFGLKKAIIWERNPSSKQ